MRVSCCGWSFCSLLLLLKIAAKGGSQHKALPAGKVIPSSQIQRKNLEGGFRKPGEIRVKEASQQVRAASNCWLIDDTRFRSRSPWKVWAASCITNRQRVLRSRIVNQRSNQRGLKRKAEERKSVTLDYGKLAFPPKFCTRFNLDSLIVKKQKVPPRFKQPLKTSTFRFLTVTSWTETTRPCRDQSACAKPKAELLICSPRTGHHETACRRRCGTKNWIKRESCNDKSTILAEKWSKWRAWQIPLATLCKSKKPYAQPYRCGTQLPLWTARKPNYTR